MSTPYHSEERHVQALARQIHQADRHGVMIATSIIPGAWHFLAAQPMLVLGSWDGQRGAWPTLVMGAPDFAKTLDGTQVLLDMTAACADPDDRLWDNLQSNGLISLLAIELATRRRLRINGHVTPRPGTSLARSAFAVTVDQAYPNCPKYIQRRTVQIDHLNSATSPVHQGTALNDEQVKLIAGADTFFVASVHPSSGTDVSHRGGTPGFVKIESSCCLRIPDYLGNSMFNTLGNIHVTGFAGLLFVDFTTGRQLQIIGDASIDWSTDPQRSWSVKIRHVRESSLPMGVRWEFVDASPFNP